MKNALPNDHHFFDLQQIRQLQELLYRIFYGIINGKTLVEKDASEFNRHVLKWRKTTNFSIEKGLPTEKVLLDSMNLNSYLHLVVEQAHQLLFSNQINRIKGCGNCGWLFLDTSKSGKRKWYNMKTCGNEVKARCHYQKIKDDKSKNDQ